MHTLMNWRLSKNGVVHSSQTQWRLMKLLLFKLHAFQSQYLLDSEEQYKAS